MFRTILKRYTSSHLLLLCSAVFISIVAFSSVFPLLPRYAKMFQASDVTIGFLAASFALAQFLFSPIWGRLSDIVGRKKIISIGLLGIAITLFCFGLVQNLTWLFILRFLQGLFASAVIPTARAYLADITTPENRVKAMGQLGAALALGFTLGPALGGLLAEDNISLPFFVAAILTALNFVFVLFFLPKSPLAEGITGVRFGRKNFVNVFYLWQGLRSYLAPLFLLSFTWAIVVNQHSVTLPLLAIEKFSMSSRDLGFLFTAMGIVAAITQFFLLAWVSRKFGRHNSIILGFSFLAVGFFLINFVPQTAWLYLIVSLMSLGSSLSNPVTTALISQETKQGQGITMGVTTAFESSGGILGPLLGSLLFSFGFHLPFLMASLFIVVVLALVITRTNFCNIGKGY